MEERRVHAHARLILALCLLAGLAWPSASRAADATGIPKAPVSGKSAAALPPCMTPEMLQQAGARLARLSPQEALAEAQAQMAFYSGMTKALKNDDFDAFLASITPQLLEKDKRDWGERGPILGTYNLVLAMRALAQGHTDEAIGLQQKEIARKKRVFGEDSACALEAQGRLAEIFMRLAQFDRALELTRDILRKTDNHVLLTDLHRYQCVIALRRGDLATAGREAEAMLKEANASSVTQSLGTSYYAIDAQALSGYADGLAGEKEKAAQELAAALALGEKMSEKSKTPLGNLSVFALRTAVLSAEGKYPEALTQADDLIGRERHGMGGMGMTTGFSLPAKAFILNGMGRYNEAFDLRLRALNDETERIVQTLAILPDSAAGDFIAASRPLLLESLDAGARREADDPARLAALYGVWLQRKGLLLEQARRYQAYQFSGLSEEGKRLKASVDAAKEALFVALSRAPADDPRLGPLRENLRTLEERFKKIEPSLVTTADLRRITPSALAAALPKGSVLIDFARALDSESLEKDPRTPFAYMYPPASVDRQPQVYLAFILHPGDGNKLAVVRLGDAKAIDAAVAAFRRAVARDPGEKGENIHATGVTLSRLIFAPLAAHLDNAETVYLSPDGQLNLVPFEALPDTRDSKNDAWLLDSHAFRYVAAARDLVRPKTPGEPGPPLFVGNPDFNCTPAATAASPDAVPLSSSSREVLGRELQNLTFTPLPATLQEVTEARALEGATGELYSGCAADKAAVLQKKVPKILHLATHGFFLPDETDGRSDADLAMRRSGLALAGANAADKGAGLLMAEEALSLNLTGTDLVVLSACQTGLGEVQSGEGVYGLRRAFAQAGAAGQIMSLWSVPDKETQELMQAFYQAMKDGASPGDALHKAAVAEKTITTARYGFAHPFYWGAFVYLGTQGALPSAPSQGALPPGPPAGG